MKEYFLKEAVREGRVLCGMSLSTPAPTFVEILGYSGFDFVFIDTEHTTISLEDLSNLIVASELSGIAAIVRVPDNHPSHIRRVLEIGAEGVIIPHVNSREDALRAVQAAKFPPEGIRGVGTMVRSNKFGFPEKGLAEYARCSNEGTTVIPLIEEKEAVENIEEIAEVRGVDALLLGPADLSLSLGLPGQYQNPEVLGSLMHVMAVAKSRGIPVMSEISYLAQPVTVENVRNLIENGLRLITFGSVEGAIKQACLRTMENMVSKIR